jgi:hypothetical protein
VAEVRRKFSSADQQFDTLVEAAATAVAPLDRVVCEALYQHFRNEEFYPGDEWGENPRVAEEEGLLTRDDGEFALITEHSKIRNALAALKALRLFIEEPPEGFMEAYQNEHEDTFAFENKNFLASSWAEVRSGVADPSTGSGRLGRFIRCRQPL